MKRFAALLALFILFAANGNASEKKPVRRFPGIEFNSVYSGNGLQAAYFPALRFAYREHVGFSAGPRFSVNEFAFTGFAVEFRYAVMTESESNCNQIRLSGFVGEQYFLNEKLSAGTVRMEKLLHSSSEYRTSADYESLRFNGNEISAGIHTSYRFKFGLLLQAKIGAGFYTLKQVGGQPMAMNHELKSVSMLCGAGLGWTFGK